MQKNGYYLLVGQVKRPINASLIADHEGLGSEELIKKSKKGGNIDALQYYIHAGTRNLKTDN